MAAAIVGIVTPLAAQPAWAQFGGIFGNDPPRPPSSVPGGRPDQRPEPQWQQFPPPQQQTQPQPQRQLPPPTGLPPAGGSPRSIQTQPLQPPPGTAAPRTSGPTDILPGQNSPPRQGGVQDFGQPPLSGPQPAQRQPRGAPSATAGAAPAAGEAVVSAPPVPKIVNTSAIFSGLDKITGRIIKFDVAIGETVQFGALQVTPRACYTRPPTETQNTDTFVEVDEVTLQGEVKRIFTGWMFASSPGLNAIEHPIYDIWIIDCKGGTPAVTAEAPAATPAAAAPPRPEPRRPQQQQRQPAPPPRVPPPPFR